MARNRSGAPDDSQLSFFGGPVAPPALPEAADARRPTPVAGRPAVAETAARALPEAVDPSRRPGGDDVEWELEAVVVSETMVVAPPPADLWDAPPTEEPLHDASGAVVVDEPDELADGPAVPPSWPPSGPGRPGRGGALPPAAGRAIPIGEPPRPGEPEPRREPKIFVVSELVRAARQALEGRFADVRVEGEISGFKRSGPGHFYFCLKDGEAQVDCVMFSREAARVKWKPGDGQQVRVRGRLTIYEGRGKFQMSVTAMEPAGAGILALAFEELKKKLAAEGLFAPARKRPLPFLPRRIGVVTSSTGAVIRDIVRVAHRRFPIPILLAPTPVQGEGAALAIVAALRAVAAVPDVDLVIVARGGGSLEDLWSFNDELVARAIAACRVPVISAVGHETDFTIADFVADLRAPTPSAAAELAVPVAADLRTELAVLGRRSARAVHSEIRACRLALERGRARLGDPRRLVDDRRQMLDDLAGRALTALRTGLHRRRNGLRGDEARLLRAHPQRRLGQQRAELVQLERRMTVAINNRIGARRRALEAFTAKLGPLSPLGVLERGYSLARRSDGHVVKEAAGLKAGEALHVRFHDGEVRTTVDEIRVDRQDEENES